MIRSFLSKFKTLESIQASFTQAVDDLQNLRERNRAAVQKNLDFIKAAEQRNLVLDQENAKATRFQANLEELLG